MQKLSTYWLSCDTKSHNWLIGGALANPDQSQRSPAGTIGGMLAVRCAVGMKPFRQCTKSHVVRGVETVRWIPSWKPYPGKG